MHHPLSRKYYVRNVFDNDNSILRGLANSGSIRGHEIQLSSMIVLWRTSEVLIYGLKWKIVEYSPKAGHSESPEVCQSGTAHCTFPTHKPFILQSHF